jgi:hypothetical protein
MRASVGGRIVCDTGPNNGLHRYDGSLYLTPREDEELTGELTSPAGLPAVGPGRFELRDSGDGLELVCTTCERPVRDRLDGDDLTSLVGDAADHECADLAQRLNARLDEVGDAIKARGGQR